MKEKEKGVTKIDLCLTLGCLRPFPKASLASHQKMGLYKTSKKLKALVILDHSIVI